MTQKELFQHANEGCGYNKYNGIKVTEIEDGFCAVEAELRPESTNPWGTAHGGFVYSLCDVAAGVVVSALGCGCVTLSGNVYYIRPSTGKKLRADGRIIKNGKTVILVETNVYNDEGVHTARGEFQIFVVEDNRK